MSTLLIVESPSKAKTLQKYLGAQFRVLASFGHVRDLIPKNGAVDPEASFAMHYEIISRNQKHVDQITHAVKTAQIVYLATDPDREGEAIAWHICEILRAKKLLTNKTLGRVVFHEITKNAVNEALKAPRDIAMSLVNAQQARRALDYLVGFNLSPLLWKKIRRGLSAGRVQSPALRLIAERELEIQAFHSQEYWTIHLEAALHTQSFGARMMLLDGEKLEQFSIINASQQEEIVGRLIVVSNGIAKVLRVDKKSRNRHPSPPFTTSTLQQESVRKLGFSTTRAMRIAQQLYEGINTDQGTVGLITYMRTDSVNLASEAIAQIRSYISQNFDNTYLPASPVLFKTKTKNAQEAHEAIRPTDINRTPELLRAYLSDDQFRLYEIIWKRTLACQMTMAQFDVTTVDLAVGENVAVFRANGQIMTFPGFIAVYTEGRDENEDEDEHRLPALERGDILNVSKIYGEQHHTEPPPRYSEASLVKSLEEYGIGRPSTYASIISTLQDRNYVVLDKKRFVPTDVGQVVNKFLTEYFAQYVDYDFTAKLEDALDSVAAGTRDWLPLLSEFWQGFNKQLKDKANVERPGNVVIDEDCPKCGRPLQKQLSRYGSFIGCTGFNNTENKCDYKRSLDTSMVRQEPVHLGIEPSSGQAVMLLHGPYGHYVQLGMNSETDKTKPKRVSLPKDIQASTVDLALAQSLLALPRDLGKHPQTNKPVLAHIGRYGPYVAHNGQFKSIPKSQNVLTIALSDAMELLAQARHASPVQVLGMYEGNEVAVFAGRFGYYVRCANLRASLGKDVSSTNLTLEKALDLLARKKEKPAKKPPALKRTKR